MASTSSASVRRLCLTRSRFAAKAMGSPARVRGSTLRSLKEVPPWVVPRAAATAPRLLFNYLYYKGLLGQNIENLAYLCRILLLSRVDRIYALRERCKPPRPDRFDRGGGCIPP